MLTKLKKIKTEVRSRNPYWEYRYDEYFQPDGNKGEYHYVHTPGSVLIVPVLSNGKFVLVKQYRILNEKFSIEFPGGGTKQGLSSLSCAINELKEETGYFGDLTEIGQFNPCEGLTDENCTVFKAANLQEGIAQPESSEEFELVILSRNEIKSYIQEGKIWSGMSIAAWALYEISK